MDLEDTKIISDKLCNALRTIGTNCIKHMSECYNVEDYENTRRGHIEVCCNLTELVTLLLYGFLAINYCRGWVQIKNLNIKSIVHTL